MTEQFESDAAGARTGIPAVDDVLASVDELDGLPPEEHVAVFTRAHEQLRSVLDAPGEPA